jgi:hypothetical protein
VLYTNKVDSNEHLKIGNTLGLLYADFFIVKVALARFFRTPPVENYADAVMRVICRTARLWYERLLGKTECLMVVHSVAFWKIR